MLCAVFLFSLHILHWKVLLLSAAWLTLMRTIPLWQRLIFANCSSSFGSRERGAWPYEDCGVVGVVGGIWQSGRARRVGKHNAPVTRADSRVTLLIPYPLHSRIPYRLRGESLGKCGYRRGGGKTIFRRGRGGMRGWEEEIKDFCSEDVTAFNLHIALWLRGSKSVCVLLYLLHTGDPNPHSTSEVRTFFGSEDIIKSS